MYIQYPHPPNPKMGDKYKKRKINENYNNVQQAEPPLDRLSTLPDAILVDILSLIPTKTAVSTSVLSKRWRYLWTHLTSLYLNFRHFPKHSAHFYSIVDHLLTRLTSPFLHTFCLRVPFPRHQHFESWLRHLSARNIKIINVSVDYFHSDKNGAAPGTPFTMPFCIFQTQSLVCLNFPTYRFQYYLPHDDDTHVIPQLPNLKLLRLNASRSQCGFVAKLVRSCPLLEHLFLSVAQHWSTEDENDDDIDDDSDYDDDDTIIDVSSGSLRRLHLNMLAVTKNFKIVIDAPKLNSFSLFASNWTTCCSFVKKPVALNQATVITASKPLVLSLLPVISTVRLLRIPAVTIRLFEDCKDNQGNSFIFRNLTELNLQLGTESEDLQLGSGDDGLDTFPFELPFPSLLSRVKKIEVVKHNAKYGKIMKFAKYMLSNAPSLEMLSFIDVHHPRQTPDRIINMVVETVFCLALNVCSREFPKCRIKFRGQYATLPADNGELQRMRNRLQALVSSLSSTTCGHGLGIVNILSKHWSTF